LYNMQDDPNEWQNLAGDIRYASVLEQHRQWMPAKSRKPVPGSASRILIYDEDAHTINWEGDDILPGAPIPELED
ncbi:MAG: choline-sulfatase, partial [Planctomycetaceae bacterium]|nr:choline-sulfatase [Planctomycetaceae bacterium]